MSVANLRVSIGSRQYQNKRGTMRERSALAKILYILRRARHAHHDDLMHRASGNMPYWAAKDSTQFWRVADQRERKNSVFFVEHLLVLPRDLSLDQHIEFLCSTSRYKMVSVEARVRFLNSITLKNLQEGDAKKAVPAHERQLKISRI